MQNYENNKEWITAIMDMLSAHFGNDVEFVVHDLSLDYEHTIVDIRNGNVTNRKIGDTGDILGLEVLGGEKNDQKNFFNYINYTADGKTLRSSTLFIPGEDGKPILCIAINEDITRSVAFENYLREKNGVSSVFDTDISYGRGDIDKILDALMDAAQASVGKNTSIMTKEDKLNYIRYLDKRGAFLITKSSQRVWTTLGISKFTFYNYLDMIHKEAE